MEGLLLEVVTRDGVVLSESGLEAVVLRRKERRFEQGSEIVALPRRASCLVRLPDFVLRYRRGTFTGRLRVLGGFAEIREGKVCILADATEEAPFESADACGRPPE